VGLLGARRRLAGRLDELKFEGMAESALARLHAPIGLDIGGKAPWEVALSVIGEITALRHARLPAAPRQPASISSPQGLAKA
jgi:xanthine dehydrogenase accessory factor